MTPEEQTTDVVPEREAFVREFQQAYYRRGTQTNETGLVASAHVAADLVAAARADEREWFKSALTSDVGDLLDVDWLRENWWVKHVVAEHLAGPPEPRKPPAATEEADRG